MDNNDQNPNPLMPETNGAQNEIPEQMTGMTATAGQEGAVEANAAGEANAPQPMTGAESQVAAEMNIAQSATEAGVEAQVAPENNAAPIMSNINEAQMESNTNAMPNPPMMQVMEPKKRGAGMVIALVTAIAVALAGAGFGVYESLEAKKAQDKLAKVEKTVKQKNDELKKVREDNENKPKPQEETKPNQRENQSGGAIDIKNANGAYIQNQTLFVPSWGLKFKLPDDLVNYGIAIDYSIDEKNEVNSFGFNAILKSDYQKNAQALYYDNIYSCAITRVEKVPGTAPNVSIGKTIYKQFDGYFIGVSDFSTPKCEVRLNIDKVIKKLETVFLNPEKM